MSQWWLDYWSLLSRSGRAVAHDEEHLGLTFIFLLAENGDLGSLWNLSFRGRVGKVAGASVSEFVTHAGRLVIIRCRPCPRDGRVARRRETRSDFSTRAMREVGVKRPCRISFRIFKVGVKR